MWWRFLTFCVCVCIVLFVVLSCIHGQPVLHLFFHRCCEDDIENDQVIFEDFTNNYLRERLIGDDSLVFNDNESFVSSEEVEELLEAMKNKFNVHDPRSRVNLTIIELSDIDQNSEDSENSLDDEILTDKVSNKDENDKNFRQSDTLDVKDTINTDIFEDENSVESIENDSQKQKSFADGLTKVGVGLSTTETSLKKLVPSFEDVESTTHGEWDSLKNSILSEMDSDESCEVTTRKAETDLGNKVKDLGIIK